MMSHLKSEKNAAPFESDESVEQSPVQQPVIRRSQEGELEGS
jgi:hypothetical protein